MNAVTMLGLRLLQAVHAVAVIVTALVGVIVIGAMVVFAALVSNIVPLAVIAAIVWIIVQLAT